MDTRERPQYFSRYGFGTERFKSVLNLLYYLPSMRGQIIIHRKAMLIQQCSVIFSRWGHNSWFLHLESAILHQGVYEEMPYNWSTHERNALANQKAPFNFLKKASKRTKLNWIIKPLQLTLRHYSLRTVAEFCNLAMKVIAAFAWRVSWPNFITCDMNCSFDLQRMLLWVNWL